ncbi:MAG: protein kinase [Acidobacteriia bacterium]|nr:protein kinase [Terriglobia bacterium]
MTPERWREVETMYQATMDREPEVRSAYLVEACRGDEDLRRDVESLLELNGVPALVDDAAWQAFGELLDHDLSVAVGTQLGPYRIEGVLGAGGMGRVYAARDTRLDRVVALKISNEEFNERFGREVRAVAALNHPNICTLHDVGPDYLVMELVEGPTLAERIKQGPVPVEEAIAIARQIVAALEAAHELGIVHRDLKPGNIKIKPDGTVKVLDFGLAKRRAPDSASEAKPESSPTLSMAKTGVGVILGTAAYMSPEQARGTPVDKRSDIWAFGVVLFEMLTGRQLFGGETVSDTLAAVLKSDLDWASLPAETPAAIRRLLRRSLERDSKRRMRDIGDAEAEFEEALQLQEISPNAASRQVAKRLRWGLAVLGLAALALLAIAVAHLRETAPEPAAIRFQIPLPEKSQVGPGSRLALSPDGHRLAFSSIGPDGGRVIWVRALDSFESRPIAKAEIASGIFWSPDSRWIAFWAGGKLKKIEVDGVASGGSAQTICNSGPAPGGTWNRDGVILFGFYGGATGLLRVSQAGGEPVPITTLDRSRQEVGHAMPQFLPDGHHYIYFVSSSNPDNTGVYLGTLDSTRKDRLLRTHAQGLYVPRFKKSDAGDLLFLKENTLMAQRFDTSSFTVSGEPFPVADPVWSFRTYGLFSASANGTLAYRPGIRAESGRLAWFDRQGKPSGEVGLRGTYGFVALSPNGRLAAFDQFSPSSNIWKIDLVRDRSTQFTFEHGRAIMPVWSPDGSRVVFASNRDGPFNLYQKDATGTGNEELLWKSNDDKFPLDWSADGRFFLYGVSNPATGSDLWILPLKGDRNPKPFLNSRSDEIEAQFSPGPSRGPRWVAYSSDEYGGQFEVYLRQFTELGSAPGAPLPVSTGGGRQPRWRSDGKELFFVANGVLMAVDVSTSPQLQIGKPKPLFPTGIIQLGTRREFPYAVSPDGNRFLLIKQTPTDGADPGSIHVVINWTAGPK